MERLSVAAAAALAGVRIGTWRAYVWRNQAPPPDGKDEVFGRLYWLRETVECWLAERPGRGARTDLR